MNFCKRLLFFLFLIVLQTATAQELQKLQQQVRTAGTIQDKLYALDALANYYSWTEGGYDEAKAYGQQMIALAEASNNPALLAQAYVLNGIRLVEAVPSTEREQELRGSFARAIEIAKKNNLPFYAASAYIGLSGIPFHVVLIDGDEALLWGRQAYQYATAAANDSLRAMAFIALGNGYRFKKDKLPAFKYFSQAIDLTRQTNDPYLQAYCYRAFARFYHDIGDYDKALAHYTNAIAALKKKKNLNYRDKHWLFMTQWNVTWSYAEKKDFEKAKESARKCLSIAKVYNLPNSYHYAPLNQLLGLYLGEHKYEEAKAFLRQNPYIDTFYKNQDYESQIYKRRAAIYQHTGQPDSANFYYLQAIASIGKAIPVWSPGLHRDYGYFLMEQGKLQQAIQQFQLARQRSEEFKNISSLVDAYHDLDSAYFKAGDLAKAYQYDKMYHRYKDSLNQLSRDKELAVLEVESEQKRIEQEQREKEAQMVYQNHLRTYLSLGGLAALLVIAGILYRNNRQKQRANELLQQQKQKSEQALRELKRTQAQLIHQEKVASLGQLTAGIAHEIQNPLNFVNNFTEVNKELIEELKQEQSKEQRNLYNEKELLEEMKENTNKIAYHGKRAETIIKSMLEHSRAAKGEKQSTDINALAEEYLRLAYHGVRAKDKTFHALLETHFDPSVGKVTIAPQDLGRVLLNLLNNAFYAVNEKRKYRQDDLYDPTVAITTKKLQDKVEIKVYDNGMGIPVHVRDKIFQPFFTTKPTGEGTGLGLSLSYDIITKSHGGEMTVHSEEGAYTEFVIRLPHTVAEAVQPQV